DAAGAGERVELVQPGGRDRRLIWAGGWLAVLEVRTEQRPRSPETVIYQDVADVALAKDVQVVVREGRREDKRSRGDPVVEVGNGILTSVAPDQVSIGRVGDEPVAGPQVIHRPGRRRDARGVDRPAVGADEIG